MAMSSSSWIDHRNNDRCSQPKGFLTPPPTWRSNRRPAAMPRSEMKPQTAPLRGDSFHVIHKIPSGDSPYVRAKHVQLVERDPSRAISLFWAAINAGDRVDSALKDMAVVMKQLDRSDEAIEAIKSFRHLSPHESQESIDNILVELFKQSGRREEEIELLQRKLKRVEEGMAFSGRKTKVARSQGKKIQITVQKEYSRLLGNLAWAYMQNGDFKSAEEHYRKALSFEADKNKQCNLAVCLMHMNKLTEAKFLLETIPSANGAVEESYAKSYERASEILAEFELQNVVRPKRQVEYSNEYGMVKPKSFGSEWSNNSAQLSPLPSSAKMNNGAFTDFAYEKRADFDWRTNHHQPTRDIPKVPLTQPRRCLSSSEDQRKPVLSENAHGNGSSSHCRKLCFESSTSSEKQHLFANQDAYYSAYSAPDEMPNIFPHFLEKFNGGEKKRSPSVKPLEDNDEETSDMNPCKTSTYEHNKKSWADMVEEDEQEFRSWQSSFYVDENVDSNIIPTTPNLHNLAEEVTEEMGSINLGGGYLTQPDKTGLSKNQPLRRSQCFDQNHIEDLTKLSCSTPLTTKALDFEGKNSGDVLGSGKYKNRRRLQVFEDITHLHGSPRH